MTKFVQETFAKGTEMEIVGATWSRDCWFNWMILNDCSTLQISRAYLNSSCILFAFDSGSLWGRSERLEIVFANEFVILTPPMLMEFLNLSRNLICNFSMIILQIIFCFKTNDESHLPSLSNASHFISPFLFLPFSPLCFGLIFMRFVKLTRRFARHPRDDARKKGEKDEKKKLRKRN